MEFNTKIRVFRHTAERLYAVLREEVITLPGIESDKVEQIYLVLRDAPSVVMAVGGFSFYSGNTVATAQVIKIVNHKGHRSYYFGSIDLHIVQVPFKSMTKLLSL